jgi:hypothetical protein
MSDPYENLEPAEDPDVPDWDDEYLDRVSGRLLFNYDLDKDVRAGGEPFSLYGEMRMENEKHFLHPGLSYAHHESTEHVYARRTEAISVADLESLVELGHDLADETIDPDPDHYSTEFVFVPIVDGIPDDVRDFVEGFRERTMLKYGYNGHYEIQFVVVAPDQEDVVSSRHAHVEEAFRLWTPIEDEEPSWWDLVTRRLQI